MSKPLIFVTNDDGINAPGLRALARALESLGEVILAAPADEKSAVSHSLTIHHPVRIWPVGKRRFAVTGTPVDCVLFGLQKLTDRKPDLLVSGINAGANVGDDTLYSGTVAAAREGSLYQVCSIAVSHAILNSKPDYLAAAEFTRDLAAAVLKEGLPPGVFLNLNFPAGKPIGVKITRQGTKEIQDSLISEKDDPRGQKYYWIGQDVNDFTGEPDTDYFALKNGYISISPLQRDATAYRALEAIQSFALSHRNGDRKRK
ncbi:MAG TPA: 5'/3'-nucleotidase SurE [Acidobacteriota bacterium]|jgi:5'-nucleotidase